MLPTLFNIIYLFLIVATLAVTIYFVYTLYGMWSAAPYVPMSKQTVTNMMQLLQLADDDVVIDLGSGDGRAVFAAAKQAKTATGVEINPVLYIWSTMRKALSSAKNVSFHRSNLWSYNTSSASVIILFFIPGKMSKLATKLQAELKPGSRVASYGFRFPDWQPEMERDKIHVYRIA